MNKIFVVYNLEITAAEEQLQRADLLNALSLKMTGVAGRLIDDDQLSIGRNPVQADTWVVAGNIREVA